MPDTTDRKEMYLTMVRASEKAIRILIEAQQKCEELYIETTESTETPPPPLSASDSGIEEQ